MVSIQERTWARSVLLEERSSSAAGYAWTVLFVVLLASVAASLNQFKVPPLVPILMAALGLGLGQAGMLMSIFAVAGLLLALPAGLIVQRLGPRRAGMIAVGLLVLGSAWGATAQSAAPLLASRGLEGAGMALIAVAGPAAIALWFPREQQGAPMGIWATWVPLGNVAVYNLAPALGTSMGWQAVWWAGAGFGLVALVLYWRLMRLPPSSTGDRGRQRRAPAGDRSPRLGAALANRSIWLLTLEFACLNIALIGLYTFFPTYLAEVRGYSLVHAAFIVSLSTLVALGSAPLAGWLSDRIGSRRLVIAIPFLVVAGLLLLPFHLTGWPLYALMVLLGAVSAATPTATFAAAPEVTRDPRLAGIGLAVVSLGMNLGMVIGPILFGSLVERMGWALAGYCLVPICLVGFVAAWMVKVR